MRIMVVDIYRLTDNQMKEKDLYYKNRMKLYNYTLKTLEDCAIRDENINDYYIGQIIEF